MKYLAVLGRQPEISIAELEALFFDMRILDGSCRLFSSPKNGGIFGGPPSEPLPVHIIRFETTSTINVARLGGILKLAVKLVEKPLDFLLKLPEGKITLGVSDYSMKASRKTATTEALKLKRFLVKQGRSVRVVENKDAVLSTATSLHNGLSGKNERKVELIKIENDWYKVIGVQDIDAYAKRDQARPARDARVGMLPPKLAQILINLCGPLPEDATILDPFCGTGVVLQEALLMGYRAYGTDISERMIKYSKKNLEWLMRNKPFHLSVGDATTFKWEQLIDAVACEGYLGKPMSKIPNEMELKVQKQECGVIVLGFLRNLIRQIEVGTPVTMAVPAWMRENGEYSRLDVLDEIEKLGYNVDNKSREGLFYHRDKQIVARDILILRKK